MLTCPTNAEGGWRARRVASVYFRCQSVSPLPAVASPCYPFPSIWALSATCQPQPSHPQQSINWPKGKHKQAEVLCEEAIKVTDELHPFSNNAEYGAYLLPIKKSAGKTLGIARAGTDDSRLAQGMAELYQLIVAADRFLDTMLERSAAFPTVVKLMIVKERIAAESQGVP